MRNWIFSISLIALTLSCYSQELDQILDAHYDAAAQEKMEKVETIITSGKNAYSMAGYETSFMMYQARPNKLRIQSDYQGSLVIQTYNGTTGWMYAPAMGISEPTEMKGNELETFLNQTDFENPLWNYKEKGTTLELMEASDEGMTDHLKLTIEEGDELNFYIDRKSHLITSIKSSQLIGGSKTEIEIVFIKYMTIKGIPVAHHVITKMNGEEVTTIDIEKVEFNKKIDPELFEKPGDLEKEIM